MRYRKLGNTGLEVSSLSFGASSLGAVFHDIDLQEGIKTVHTAVEMGINYLDVSPYYGLTAAETVLGQAIPELPRDRLVLSSKAGRYGANQFDFSSERIVRSVDESLRRLQTDYLDILLLHDIEFGSMTEVLEEGLPALQRLKESGKIRFFGVSGFPLAIFQRVLQHADVDVILSYCHYALNNTTLLAHLPLFEQRGVGVINASPLSMGLLSSRGAPDWHPASLEIKQACQRAAKYCEENGANLAQLAVQFATANEQIPTTLVSTASSQNMMNNIHWVDEALDPSLLQAVMEILAPIRDLEWPSGRPENQANGGTTQ